MQKPLIATLIAALALMLFTPAIAAKHPQIFTISRREAVSARLGAAGVPVWVVNNKKQRKGFYITRITGEGDWRSMGLVPGDVLLEVDRRSVHDARMADTVLENIFGDKHIMYVRVDEAGIPTILQTAVHFYPRAPLATATSSPGTTSYGSASRNKPAQTTVSVGELEQYMFSLVNQDRRKHGAPSVRFDSKLGELARDYAKYMLSAQFFNHVDPKGRNPQDRAREAGIRCGVFENISFYDRGMLPDRDLVKRSQENMMNEPPNQQNHRSNILSADHECVGIGIAVNDGTIMMVQEFANSSP